MQDEYSVAVARDHLTRILQEVESGRPARITRRGRPVAVIIAYTEYERLQGGRTPWQAYESWRANWADLLEDVDLEGLRDPSPGRDLPL